MCIWGGACVSAAACCAVVELPSRFVPFRLLAACAQRTCSCALLPQDFYRIPLAMAIDAIRREILEQPVEQSGDAADSAAS